MTQLSLYDKMYLRLVCAFKEFLFLCVLQKQEVVEVMIRYAE